MTETQSEVFHAIERFQAQYDYPPTIREIANAFGWSSQSSAQQHVDALIKKGYLSRKEGVSRSIRILKPTPRKSVVDFVEIPLVGRIAAGSPTFALEEVEDVLPLPRSVVRSAPGQKLFALRVKGDSMIKAGIFDGDIAVLRSGPEFCDGQIAAVVLDEEATLKRVFRVPSGVRLHPENDSYEDRIIPLKNSKHSFRLAGVLMATLRTFT